MISKGYQDFQLSNGAIGRFIFRELREGTMRKGSYIGFALREEGENQYKVYGRIVGMIDVVNGRRVGIDGYGIIGALQPKNTCYELAEDQATAAFVSSDIKKGYGGIGSTLMQLSMAMAVIEGLDGIMVLQSLSVEADNFYQRMGFQETAPGQWYLPLEVDPSELAMPLSEIKPKQNISADWRPPEAPTIRVPNILTPSPAAPTPASIMQRITSWLLGRTTQEQTA
jgi:hypothetical protein